MRATGGVASSWGWRGGSVQPRCCKGKAGEGLNEGVERGGVPGRGCSVDQGTEVMSPRNGEKVRLGPAGPGASRALPEAWTFISCHCLSVTVFLFGTSSCTGEANVLSGERLMRTSAHSLSKKQNLPQMKAPHSRSCSCWLLGTLAGAQ